MSNELHGQTIANKYLIGDRIGSFGPAGLFRGKNILLERPLLIAVLEPELAEDPVIAKRFFDEGRVPAKLDHANILATADLGTDQGGFGYVAFENAAGELLSEAIAREGRLPLEMTAEVIGQAAAALDAARISGVIHGNLSPESIIAVSENEGKIAVKVFGFGSANVIDDPDPRKSISRFPYLAPEQCAGADEVTERGDIYSLGAIAYAMLAGSPPHEGSTATEIMMRTIEEPPPPLSSFGLSLPAGVEPAILTALSKDPDARYDSAQGFADDLKAALASPAASAAAASAGGNNIWKTAFLVLVGVSALTIAMIYATSVKQTDPTTTSQANSNGMPVQPINPATGVEEQNLANLPPDPLMANTNTSVPGADVYPGGDGYNPWANGGNPPPGGPPMQPGGPVITVPNGQSPFMSDPNCVPQPSGIMLCTVPVSPTPQPKQNASPTPKPGANANSNTAPAGPTPTPKPTAAPSRSPAAPSRSPQPARTPDPAPAGSNDVN